MLKLIFSLLLLTSVALPVAASDLPKMEVSGLVVVDGAKNATIINNRIYYEGDYIEVMKDGSMNSIVPGGRVKVKGTLIKVEKVTTKGVTLLMEDQSYLVKMKKVAKNKVAKKKDK